MKYTTTFKKAVLRKVLPPENRSVHSVSVEVGVGEMTIHRWIAQVKYGTMDFEQDEENPSGQRNMTLKKSWAGWTTVQKRNLQFIICAALTNMKKNKAGVAGGV